MKIKLKNIEKKCEIVLFFIFWLVIGRNFNRKIKKMKYHEKYFDEHIGYIFFLTNQKLERNNNNIALGPKKKTFFYSN